jgi:hypothetical protein
MRKFFAGTPWGIGTPPGNGGNHPEASLGESPERTASSVGSGHKSRVMEPRKIEIAGAFAFMPAGATPERQTPRATVRPGSKSRADVRKGSLGTWEILRSPLRTSQIKDDPGSPTSRHPRGGLAAGVSERAKHEGVSLAERNEAGETDQGSRSVFIVAPESRETDPRKPVSSQGRRRSTDPSLGHTR